MTELNMQEHLAQAAMEWSQKAAATGYHLMEIPLGYKLAYGESQETATHIELTEDNITAFRAGVAAMLNMLEESPMASVLRALVEGGEQECESLH
jgi:hypothetical protein